VKAPCAAADVAHPTTSVANTKPTRDVRTVLLAKDGARPTPRVGMIVQTPQHGREPRHVPPPLAAEATWNVIVTVVPAP